MIESYGKQNYFYENRNYQRKIKTIKILDSEMEQI